MDIQAIFDLAKLCHLKGIKNAIISPGSRNAVLTIAFARYPSIKCYSVPDERSAAFMALGMSLKTQTPTVLICTSGSAGLNYAPAVAEAFFNKVPLLIITADRPSEWVDQQDGQTVYQANMYGRHVKSAYNFPTLDSYDRIWHANRMTNEAINLCTTKPMGPVHLNIPFIEPFYPEPDQSYSFADPVRIIKPHLGTTDSFQLEEDSFKSKRILIVLGQGTLDQESVDTLSALSEDHKIPVVADIIANGHDIKHIIQHQDVFLKNNKGHLRPDVLITTGLSVISKNLKMYLRRMTPKAHWHIGEELQTADTYQCLTDTVRVDPKLFFKSLKKQHQSDDQQMSFFENWQQANVMTKDIIDLHESDILTEFWCYKQILSALPNGADLHLANSMAVRYANVIGIRDKPNLVVFCNRGTSGIDGSNSTAVGTAIMTDRPTYLLTGDVAFLYDRNAFWHHHLPSSLHIIVFNNHGGGIFQMIDGPAQHPKQLDFFETPHQRNAQLIAQEFDFEYLTCDTLKDFDAQLTSFLTPNGKRKILEIFTNQADNKKSYKELFKKIIEKTQ